MSDETVPLDATAMRAEAVVRAAIEWGRAQTHAGGLLMTAEDWELRKALAEYGDEYKGLRGR